MSPPARIIASSPATDVAAWTQALFRAIDAKDTEAFLAFLTPQARFAFGNVPAAEGTAGIRATLDGFFASIASLTHTVDHTWSVPGHVVCNGTVRYVRHDARAVVVPFCNVLRIDGERVADYRIYVDASPLFAP